MDNTSIMRRYNPRDLSSDDILEIIQCGGLDFLFYLTEDEVVRFRFLSQNLTYDELKAIWEAVHCMRSGCVPPCGSTSQQDTTTPPTTPPTNDCIKQLVTVLCSDSSQRAIGLARASIKNLLEGGTIPDTNVTLILALKTWDALLAAIQYGCQYPDAMQGVIAGLCAIKNRLKSAAQAHPWISLLVQYGLGATWGLIMSTPIIEQCCATQPASGTPLPPWAMTWLNNDNTSANVPAGGNTPPPAIQNPPTATPPTMTVAPPLATNVVYQPGVPTIGPGTI